MRLFAVALLLLLSLNACKEKDAKNVPAPGVPGELIGKWKLTSMQVTENGATVWQDVQPGDYPFVYFSRYGEPVDANGSRRHCGPTSLNINGRELKIDYHAKLPSDGPIPDCIPCPTWNLDLQQTNLVIDHCSPDRKMRYVKEK